MELIKAQDPAVYEAMNAEKGRQEANIELIASENFVSQAVMDAQGSVLTNKYAEGYPGKRYYGGCEFVDVVENIARDRLKEIFGGDQKFNHIPDHRPIWLSIQQFWKKAIQFLE